MSDPSPRPAINVVEFDPNQLTAEDKEFAGRMQRSMARNIPIGTAVGAAAPYLLLRYFAKGGTPGRVAAIIGGGIAGATVGLMRVTSQAQEEVKLLPQDSYFKALTAKILANKFPMAVAEEMELKKARESTQAAERK